MMGEESAGWNLVQVENQGSEEFSLQEGQTALNKDETYTLQLIVYNDQYVIFLNDVLLAYLDDIQFSGQQITIATHSDSALQVDFDNVKFWTLDGVGSEAILFEYLPVHLSS